MLDFAELGLEFAQWVDHGDTGSLESTKSVALACEMLTNHSLLCLGNISSNIRKKKT